MSFVIVVTAYVALLILSIFLFVSIRNDQVPRIRMIQLRGWPKIAWVASIVLLVVGLALPAIGLLFADDSGSSAGPQPPYWLSVAFVGPYVLLVPCVVMAFWRPASAALLLMATALTAPTAPFIQAHLSLPEIVDPTSQFAYFAPFVLAASFSIPALVVSLLLWSSSRGLGSDTRHAIDDSTTRATDPG